MIPILYSANETAFTNRGLGPLSDAVSCVVNEERNGSYELTMTYPVNGNHYNDITDRAIIYAIPSPYREAQPFRVYEIEAPMNGIVTIHARHLSYDLSGIPVEPFTETGSAWEVMDAMVTHSKASNPFTMWSDLTTSLTFTNSLPNSFRALLGGMEGSVLDRWHGEYEFDHYDVKLLESRGHDTDVRVAYGKNITDFKMTRDMDSMVTGIYPYWTDGETVVEISGKVLTIIDSDYSNVLPVDLSDKFEEQPTPAQLLAQARIYVTDNQLNAPRVTFDVSFIDLASVSGASSAMLDVVDLCDTVTVIFPMYGIEADAKIVAIETDVLGERYNKVTIGTVRTTLADTLSEIGKGTTYSSGGGASFDSLFPVGTVVITSDNSAPTMGGSWTLVDKEFTPTTATDVSSLFTLNSTNTTSAVMYAVREGHTVTISCASLVNKVSIAGTNLTLGTFNLSALGASEFGFTPQFVALGDAVNALVLMDLNRTSGVLRSQNVVVRGNATSIAAGSTLMFTVVITCDYTHMTDSLCNKFYWQRTA